MRLDRQRLDPLGAQPGVAAAEAGEVVDPRDLEPDEVDGVVRDPLRVGLGEAHAHLGLEVKSTAGQSLRSRAVELAELIRRGSRASC